MSIWQYGDQSPDVTAEAVNRGSCLFCGSALAMIPIDRKVNHWNHHRGHGLTIPGHAFGSRSSETVVKRCPGCGWWTARRDLIESMDDHGDIAGYHRVFGAAGALKVLDLTDMTVPNDEIRAYLMAKYSDRLTIHPRKLEEVVGSVYGDLGYRVTVTPYSGDKGLDVILENSAGEMIGVQVKRYKNSIKVEQIHSLSGALKRSDFTRGIFLTTSSFQPGTKEAVDDFKMRGQFIELVDADRFLDVLRIAQLTSLREYDATILAEYTKDLKLLFRVAGRGP